MQRPLIRQFPRNGRAAGIQPKRLFVLAAEEYAGNAAFVQPILRDIYNEFARVRSETLQGRTTTEKVIELMESESFFYRRKIGADNRLTGCEGVGYTRGDDVVYTKSDWPTGIYGGLGSPGLGRVIDSSLHFVY